ncbi:MAG: aminotransferase class I/II-fold pyridoxal phosphate-dependent enzyme [Lachnospiraceae bacterium]|nr:aminotransferase class I/II-fold pyridoxal phosphate-dependent enzyme [Lachnospiraceae bacterium]
MNSKHGGDWVSYEEAYGKKALDFSASISPFPMPERVRKAAQEALEREDRYPDPNQRRLRRAIAEAYSLQEEEILCGTGAADLIWRLAAALQPGRVLITEPSFGEYRAALEWYGHEVRGYSLRKETGFLLQEDFLEMLTDDIDVAILCEPNNPTGLTTEKELFLQIAQRCGENRILLVVDESFQDFLDPKEHPSMLENLYQWPLLVIRSFTKLYAMASLRLGWCACSDTKLLRKMQLSGQPWPVSYPAEEAGIAALAQKEHAKTVRKQINRERNRLIGELKRLGCYVVEGEANYLLFYDPLIELGSALQDRGILLRDCSNFEGLGTGWYRAAVRSEADNRTLIRAMEEVHGEMYYGSGNDVRGGQKSADNGPVPDFPAGRPAGRTF